MRSLPRGERNTGSHSPDGTQQHERIMSASSEIKNLGIKGGVREVAGMVQKPETTIYNWFKHNPALFRAVIVGCAQIKAAALSRRVV